MKKRTFYVVASFAFLALTITSCGSESTEHVEETVVETEEEEEEVTEEEAVETFSAETFFSEKGCVACHQADTKTIGPALTEITKGYNEDGVALAKFFNGEADAIIDPAQAPLMAPQVKIIQDLSEDERNALIDFIFSHKE